MNLQINTHEKSIVICDQVDFHELKKFLKKHKMEDYSIVSKVENNHHYYPYPVQPYYPIWDYNIGLEQGVSDVNFHFIEN